MQPSILCSAVPREATSDRCESDTSPVPAREFYETLRPLCLFNLRRTRASKTGLYELQIRDRRSGEVNRRERLTSTAICLIALHRDGLDAADETLDAHRAMDALVECLRHERYAGALGLVVWASAVWQAMPLEKLLRRVALPTQDVRRLAASLTTMELAWLVSGALHEHARRPTGDTGQLVEQGVESLWGRFCADSQLMLHALPQAPTKERWRRFIANFADQIYSVQALSLDAIVRKRSRSLETAHACASRLVALQGERGQWWWHYDVRRGGCVARHYPVFSVHQYGMAPMALAALAEAGGTDFRSAADKGRAWLNANELNATLIDRDWKTIWRDIEPADSLPRRVIRDLKSLYGGPARRPPATRLEINFETRPYEWGWCLYHGAIVRGQEKGGQIV
ncbi:MAG: hypothetical protein ABR915_05315 [Thermoguttaceae bacterium]|jgi:hypothetical protein